MPRENWEEVRKRIVNYYNDAAGGNVKSTVKFLSNKVLNREWYIMYYNDTRNEEQRKICPGPVDQWK
jgi:hypothetical protein